MTVEPAPLFTDLDGVPSGGTAQWVRGADGVRLRVAHWCPDGARGTVFLLPGRTEYIEKYGVTVDALADHGFATLVIDWRGQGLSDRLIEDSRIGHVDRFSDYHVDLAALRHVALTLDLPRPWHMLAHSMGGGIALGALMDGFEVQSAAFTGPMWGIGMSPVMRPLGWALACAGPVVGLGEMLPPSTTYDTYVTRQEFKGNSLTTDPQMYKMLQEQVNAHPELGLGGPSLIWLRESLYACREMAQRPSPHIPSLTLLGAREKIVDVQRVHDRMAAWPNGTLEVLPHCEHEVLMERPTLRTDAVSRVVAHFNSSWDVGQSAKEA